MRRKRRNHSASFKAKVAVVAVRGEKTLAELAQQYDMHPNQIQEWRGRLVGSAERLFERGVARDKTPNIRSRSCKRRKTMLERGHSLPVTPSVRVAGAVAFECVPPADAGLGTGPGGHTPTRRGPSSSVPVHGSRGGRTVLMRWAGYSSKGRSSGEAVSACPVRRHPSRRRRTAPCLRSSVPRAPRRTASPGYPFLPP